MLKRDITYRVSGPRFRATLALVSQTGDDLPTPFLDMEGSTRVDGENDLRALSRALVCLLRDFDEMCEDREMEI